MTTSQEHAERLSGYIRDDGPILQRYIIQFAVRRGRHGWETSHRTVEAWDIHDAHKLAIRRSFRAGCLDPDDMRDSTWAAPYSEGLARQLDLNEYEPQPVWLENYVS